MLPYVPLLLNIDNILKICIALVSHLVFSKTINSIFRQYFVSYFIYFCHHGEIFFKQGIQLIFLRHMKIFIWGFLLMKFWEGLDLCSFVNVLNKNISKNYL